MWVCLVIIAIISNSDSRQLIKIFKVSDGVSPKLIQPSTCDEILLLFTFKKHFFYFSSLYSTILSLNFYFYCLARYIVPLRLSSDHNFSPFYLTFFKNWNTSPSLTFGCFFGYWWVSIPVSVFIGLDCHILWRRRESLEGQIRGFPDPRIQRYVLSIYPRQLDSIECFFFLPRLFSISPLSILPLLPFRIVQCSRYFLFLCVS